MSVDTSYGRNERTIHLPGPSGGLQRVAEQHHRMTESGITVVKKPLFRGPDEDRFESILEASRGGVALVVTAHPDDEAGGKAGTIYRLKNEYGMRFKWVTTTLGEHGTHNGTTRIVPSDTMREIRKLELLKAAHLMEVREIHVFNQPDGGVENDWPLVLGMAKLIRKLKPKLVLVQSGADGEHNDHVNTYRATIRGKKIAAGPYPVEEEVEPHVVSLTAEDEVMILNLKRFKHRVNTSSAALHVQANIDAHASQLRDRRYREFFGAKWAFQAGILGAGAMIAEAFRLTNGHSQDEFDLEIPPPYHPVLNPTILRV